MVEAQRRRGGGAVTTGLSVRGFELVQEVQEGMAILAKNNRVARGATVASPSDSDPQARQSQQPALKQEDSDVSTESELSDKGLELCQVGEYTCSFPFELFELPDLKNILSLDSWNFCLTEEEREQLMTFLPADLDQETFSSTLKELLSGENMYFGSPMSELFEQMKGGLCQPRVAQFREGLKCLQKKEHYHLLRKYHNSMVNSFLEMQKLWEEYPEIEIDGRLEIWRKWKDTKVKPVLQKTSEKTFNAVQKAKVPVTMKKGIKCKDETQVHKDNVGPTGVLKVSKGGVHSKVIKSGSQGLNSDETRSFKVIPLQKSGKLGGKGVLKMAKKAEKIGNETTSPVSEAGDDSPLAGTSSSLTSSEKKRKNSSAENGKQKKIKEDDSMTSSDDDGLSTAFNESQGCQVQAMTVEKPLKRRKADKKRVESSEKVPVEGQCVANFEATNDDIEIQKRKPKRKMVAEKESSESPPSGAAQSALKSTRKPIVLSMPFSLIHLLSAIRRALLLPYGPPKDPEAVCVKNISAASSPVQESDENGSDNDGGRTGLFSVPFLEAVKRVHASPGDPRVLETDEPLQDLVWGALKIMSCKTAPAGAKGWKPLASYEKETKSWSWIGPPPSQTVASLDENTLVDDWGIPSKTLSKLEEAFAIWYKHGEESRQQMVQLPPVVSTPVDERERFRDMRAQKSLRTITPSSADMRSYFRKEEVLRYSVPDRAFAYTRSDGQKSVVAPLRRGGGKPNSKARDHFMLKPDRPPHVTILCLVRDAAARLPGGVGTRADVCALIRDSQYIVENVSDSQVNQVVSGALDRLHYERDPCVRFDAERKLWIYLHTERNEEDFEDDGTSSTKRWKKQKKDSHESPVLNMGSFHNGLSSGLNQDGIQLGLPIGGNASAIYSAGRTELVYNKSSSLTSPRVLNNGSLTEDPGMPFIQLPPSVHHLHSSNAAPWNSGAHGSMWNQKQNLQCQQLATEDPEAAAAAQRDADAMIGGDGE